MIVFLEILGPDDILGGPNRERRYASLSHIDVEGTVQKIEENRDVIVGVKVLVPWTLRTSFRRCLKYNYHCYISFVILHTKWRLNGLNVYACARCCSASHTPPELPSKPARTRPRRGPRRRIARGDSGIAAENDSNDSKITV